MSSILLGLFIVVSVVALVVGSIALSQVQDNAVYFRNNGVPTFSNLVGIATTDLSLVSGSTDTAGNFTVASAIGEFSFDVVFSRPLTTLPKVVLISASDIGTGSSLLIYFPISATVVDKTKFSVKGSGAISISRVWSYTVVGEQ